MFGTAANGTNEEAVRLSSVEALGFFLLRFVQILFLREIILTTNERKWTRIKESIRVH